MVIRVMTVFVLGLGIGGCSAPATSSAPRLPLSKMDPVLASAEQNSQKARASLDARFTADQQQAIGAELRAAEDRAAAEGERGGGDVLAATRRQADLQQKYHREVAERYGLTDEEVTALVAAEVKRRLGE